MSNRSAKDQPLKPRLVGVVSFGANRTGIFLDLCRVFRSHGLDILDVASHVRFGWFAKMIVARPSVDDLDYGAFERDIRRVSRGFESRCFALQTDDITAAERGNIVVVLLGRNRPGLLAEVLEVVSPLGVNIIDIDIRLDEQRDRFVLNLLVEVELGSEGVYARLEGMRSALEALRVRQPKDELSSMIHSVETFDFMNRIDYEIAK